MGYYNVFFFSNSATHVTILGQTFNPGDIVCLEAPNDSDYPVFAQVLAIIVPDDNKFLLVRKLLTQLYSSHLNAYKVSKLSCFNIVTVSELALHDVFSIYKSSYIVVRSCCNVELLV